MLYITKIIITKTSITFDVRKFILWKSVTKMLKDLSGFVLFCFVKYFLDYIWKWNCLQFTYCKTWDWLKELVFLSRWDVCIYQRQAKLTAAVGLLTSLAHTSSTTSLCPGPAPNVQESIQHLCGEHSFFKAAWSWESMTLSMALLHRGASSLPSDFVFQPFPPPVKGESHFLRRLCNWAQGSLLSSTWHLSSPGLSIYSYTCKGFYKLKGKCSVCIYVIKYWTPINNGHQVNVSNTIYRHNWKHYRLIRHLKEKRARM